MKRSLIMGQSALNTCAFSGSRPHRLPWGYDEDDARCAALKSMLKDSIAMLIEEGYKKFLTGMAQGVDTWAALAVLELRRDNRDVQLHCVLPCMEQDQTWKDDAKKLYRSILAQANVTIYLNGKYNKNCMLERNQYMVDHSSLLLAVYSGAKRSGTGYTVNYAKKRGRKIIVIDPFNIEAQSPR